MAQELETTLTPQEENNLNNKLDTARKIDAAVQELTAGKMNAMQLFGQMQALEAVNQYTGLGFTLLMKQVKESGAYKEVPISLEDGSFKTGASFDEFCNSLGKSRSKIDEDIQNVSVLGEDFMRASSTLGLSYRQLRALRRLPEGTRKAITGEALPEDPELLRDMVEEALSKEAEAQKNLKEALLAEENKNKVLDKRNKALDAAHTEIAKLKNIPPKEAAKVQAEKERAALNELHASGLTLHGAFSEFAAKAAGILEDEECGLPAKQLVNELASGLCALLAQELIDKGLDIDFKALVYPLALDDNALNLLGEVPTLASEGGE